MEEGPGTGTIIGGSIRLRFLLLVSASSSLPELRRLSGFWLKGSMPSSPLGDWRVDFLCVRGDNGGSMNSRDFDMAIDVALMVDGGGGAVV